HRVAGGRDRDVGVEVAQPFRGDVHLGPPDVALAVQDLAVEVGPLHDVGVHAVQRAHTARDESERRVAAGATDADQADAGPLQAYLRVPGRGPGRRVDPAVEAQAPVVPLAVAVTEDRRHLGRGVLDVTGFDEEADRRP